MPLAASILCFVYCFFIGGFLRRRLRHALRLTPDHACASAVLMPCQPLSFDGAWLAPMPICLPAPIPLAPHAPLH